MNRSRTSRCPGVPRPICRRRAGGGPPQLPGAEARHREQKESPKPRDHHGCGSKRGTDVSFPVCERKPVCPREVRGSGRMAARRPALPPSPRRACEAADWEPDHQRLEPPHPDHLRGSKGRAAERDRRSREGSAGWRAPAGDEAAAGRGLWGWSACARGAIWRAHHGSCGGVHLRGASGPAALGGRRVELDAERGERERLLLMLPCSAKGVSSN